MNEHTEQAGPNSKDIAAIAVGYILREEGSNREALAAEMQIGDAARAIAACEWMAGRLEAAGHEYEPSRLRERVEAIRRFPALAGERATGNAGDGVDDRPEIVIELEGMQKPLEALSDALRVAIHSDPRDWMHLADCVQAAVPDDGLPPREIHFAVARGIREAVNRFAATDVDAAGGRVMSQVMFECALHGGILRARSWVGDLASKTPVARREDTVRLLRNLRYGQEQWPRLATFIGYRALIAREFDEGFADDLLMVADGVRALELASREDRVLLYTDLLARVEVTGADRTEAAAA